MNEMRSQLVETLFDQALERSPDERSAFLQAQCAGDQDLLKKVEQLLHHHEAGEKEGFLENPTEVLKSLQREALPDDPYVGKDFGAYRITRRLERGGMGNVYLGSRSIDFRQVVAVKVLRRGMDSEEFLRRFRNEIQILAALRKHQCIAALLDAGTTEDGLPYFVMEYVEGEPIGAYCNHHSYTIRERIELFRQVCAAVHFAHQHMVIHRDLKMNNILVRTDGLPKLIDFGIAKLIVPELSDHTTVPTLIGQQLMTLKYASPEQVRGDHLTTASDVYSLGVILYELLCGHPPFALQDRPGENHVAIICDEEPPPPSAKLKPEPTTEPSSGRERPVKLVDICRTRRTTVKRLRKSLSGDLDAIVLKALLKEPQRRYASAEELSDDLKRYLDGHPVEARPIGALQRAGRWSLRNPVPAALLLSVFLTLVGGLWHLSRLSDQLVQFTAIEGAALEAEMLSEVQDFYSKVVAEKVKDSVPVTHLYKTVEGAIPVPATFTIDLGDHIRQSQVTGMVARLYSGHPFAQREGGGPRDNFEVTALEKLRRSPDQPYYRFEPYEGKQSLRYASARIMKQSCVNCHNSHPDSTKTNWTVGEVRGVLEIIRPLDQDVARIQKGLRETFVYMLGLSVLLLGFAVLFLRRGDGR